MAWQTQVTFESGREITLPSGYFVYAGDVVRVAVVHDDQQSHDFIVGQDFELVPKNGLLLSEEFPIEEDDVLMVWNYSRWYLTNEDINLAAYATRSDLERHYGRTNVIKWADLDNDNNTESIAERIQWALVAATSYLDNRLRFGPYTVPFEDPYPLELTRMCAWYAGVLLYESRGVTDFNAEGRPQHQLHHQKRNVETMIKDVLTRRLRFNLPTSATSYPQVMSDDES